MLRDSPRRALLDAGWQQGRAIDATKYEAAYFAKGYPLQACVLRFLREFGGLSLSYPHFRDKAAMDSCNFRADEACAWDRAWLRDYQTGWSDSETPVQVV